MSRNRKAHARAQRAAARLSPPPSKGGARGGIHGASITYTRPLRLEQLEPRRVLAPIVVTSPLDVVDQADNVTSLREAIVAANSAPGPDEIQFAANVRAIHLLGGELLITDSLTISGPGESLLQIDAQQNSRVINVSATAGDVMLRGVTLNNGRVEGDNPPVTGGFAATFNGGALRSLTAGKLTLDRVSLINSSANGVHAIGGALFASGPIEIIASRIANNRAATGGGVAGWGEVAVTASTISGNTAFDGEAASGGGVYARGALRMLNATISGNASQVTGTNARATGGGIFGAAATTINHSTILGNTVSSVGNGAVATGGGVAAAIDSSDSLLVANSIIAGNFTTETAADVLTGAGSAAIRYSLVSDNDGTRWAEAPLSAADANGNFIGGPHSGPIDPLLGPLANNGGSTRTHALLLSSPAISGADPALTPGAAGAPEFDGRGAGFPRRAGVRIDMGAVENNTRTWIVDSLADGVDGNYGPGQMTLREAVELANAQTGADAIEFATALYAAEPAVLSLTNGEIRLGGGDLEIRGPGAELLTIDASASDPTPNVNYGDGSRIFYASAAPLSSIGISKLRLSGGDTGDGGAIWANAPLSLWNIVVENNAARGHGGGLYGQIITIRGGRIANNYAFLNGGGIFAEGVQTIVDVVIEGNHAKGEGGAVAGRRLAAPANTEFFISGAIIRNNEAGTGAGGVHAEGRELRLIESTISGNRGRFGGVLARSTRYLTIAYSAIVENKATDSGGGISLDGTFPGAVIESTTISGNSANGNGGGVEGASKVTFARSTIANNLADANNDGIGTGGGVRGSAANLTHAIVAGNARGTQRVADDLAVTTITADHSLVGDNAGSPFAEAPLDAPDSNGNLIGGPLHGVIDPKLSPLGNYGGRTPSHILLAGSPAIDAGDPAANPDDLPLFDQRGYSFPRVVRRLDIGAVERPAPLVVDTLVDESDGNYAPGDLSLREAIALANAQADIEDITFAPALYTAGPATIRLTRGELAIKGTLNITGPGMDSLTIDAIPRSSTPAPLLETNRVFATQGSVSISGLTLRGGNNVSDITVNASGNLTLSSVFIVDNGAGHGGAVFASGSTLSVLGSRFFGGRLIASGQQTITIADSVFLGNGVSLGTAIKADYFDELNIARTEISRHRGEYAGVLVSGGNTRIVDSTFDDNVSNAIYAYNPLSMDVKRSTFGRNTRAIWFGYADNGVVGSLSISDSTFVDNANVNGGAVAAYGLPDGSQLPRVSITGSTFSHNRAFRAGGAIYVEGFATISHSTITLNSANASNSLNEGGGGIFIKRGGLQLTNSIVAGNLDNADIPQDIVGDYQSSFSLVGVGAEFLAPLADNGGPTPTHALLPGSPAINAGDPAFTPGQGGAPEFDQRGGPFTRVAGGRIDIGAFELQSPSGALQADFDLDGDADGNDFLTWQRNLGKTTGATIRQGDATAEGDVDRDDLAVWRARFSALGGAASDQTLNPTPSERQVVRAAAAPSRRSPFLAPVAPTTGSLQRSARPQLTRALLAPTPRTALNASNSAALDAAYQGERVAAPARHEDANDPETDDLIAALDAALSEG